MWSIFRSSVRGIEYISPTDFEKSLTIGRVGTQKMTQVLFLVNPEEFLPIDKRTEALRVFAYTDPISFKTYQDNIQLARHYFPNCELYEVNLFAYLLSSKNISVNDTFFQIATNNFEGGRDHFDTFASTNCVFTHKQYDALRDPVKGDIVLARHSGQGRGVGIVHRNDYAQSKIHENGKIHVIWLNKSANQKLGDTGWNSTIGFGNAKGIKDHFQKSAEYGPTFEVLKNLKSGSILKPGQALVTTESVKNGVNRITIQSSLNKILYGPPGTGKTFSTTRKCIDICDGDSEDIGQAELRERFRKLRDVEGRIEFVTFHQSYGYEEFVEGLRPEMASDTSIEISNANNKELPYDSSAFDGGGFRLRAKPGVLKRIADRARGDKDNQYVLIIDEINRANISKVFGELVTLLEEDKREGAENEVSVTLPYSKEAFTLPCNLHVIGTMNTADRSIALFDTALRRRFEFVEMPPEPKRLREVDGVNLPTVLETINERLEYLIDRDHLVGHAWFMGCKNLGQVGNIMRNKIIPLLAEYFYDDWKKVRAVLGGRDHFVTRKKLNPPPGLEEDGGEDRYRWTVNEPPYSKEAYEDLIKPPSKLESSE